MNNKEFAIAVRQIARGLEALARALEGETLSEPEKRYRSALLEWGERGLTRFEASALLSRHGFAPQAAGAWARDKWIEVRADGLRYLTDRSRQWLAKGEG